MKVDGDEIPEETIRTALAFLLAREDPFTHHELMRALRGKGVAAARSYRCADRVLQRERKAGRLRCTRIGRDVFWSAVQMGRK